MHKQHTSNLGDGQQKCGKTLQSLRLWGGGLDSIVTSVWYRGVGRLSPQSWIAGGHFGLAEFSLFWGVLWVGLDANGLALVAFCSQWCCNYLGRAVLV